MKVLGISAANTTMLRELIRYYKIPVYLESFTECITDKGVVLTTPEGKKELPADTVIISVGYQSYIPASVEGQEHIHILGDAKKVGNLKTAIWDANDLIREI